MGENNRDPERNRPSDALKTRDTADPEKDAEGQFAESRADRKSDGVASAKPTVVTGSEDATVHRNPPGSTEPDEDWDINFDETDPDRSR
ncbi:hypothetical protein [Mycoplana sp. BE70]|uniref:hypothetical protein n=1 Tax=Mycoplana sp. BE70 TaxID=2817775 RepID=UPI0038621227